MFEHADDAACGIDFDKVAVAPQRISGRIQLTPHVAESTHRRARCSCVHRSEPIECVFEFCHHFHPGYGDQPHACSVRASQISAWYDFTTHTTRTNATTWDPLVASPYDDHGHGTAVASMAAGNLPGLTPGFRPGASLAIAKVISGNGSGKWSDVTSAIYWSVDVVHADVISISSGQYDIGPPGAFSTARYQSVLNALAYARARGVFVVIAAGNGEEDLGIPDMSWMRFPPATPDALIVGAAYGAVPIFQCYTNPFIYYVKICGPTGPTGYPKLMSTKDPEVTADSDVFAACTLNDTCISTFAGTSFSAPLAAGLAAHLLESARARGLQLPPNDLEWLIKESALAHQGVPPTQEGYGYLDRDAASRAEAILDGGPKPSGTDWDVRVFYVENLNAAERDHWTYPTKL